MSRNGSLRYQQVWTNLKARAPEQQRIAHARRQTAEQLLAELMTGQPVDWLVRLEQRRFQNEDLFELLLEVCHAALPFDPRRGFEISEVALELGGLLSARPLQDREENMQSLCRALCLSGHARRLLGDRTGAETVLSRAAILTSDAEARGFFCRAFALLRWDQGRSEEAAALLLQASSRYEELGDAQEQAACLGLWGLLLTEEGEFSRAAPILSRALRELSGARPWLAAQARLALALCLARRGQKPQARAEREQAWRFYQEVREDLLFSLLWREGQVAEGVGDLADASYLFDSVRLKFIERGYLPEATVATLQLGMVLARMGRGEETLALADELAAAFADRRGLAFSMSALRCLAEETAGGRVEVEVWNCMCPNFLIAYRLQGLYPQPIAFV